MDFTEETVTLKRSEWQEIIRQRDYYIKENAELNAVIDSILVAGITGKGINMRIANKKIGSQSNGYGRIGCDMALYDEIVDIANKCGFTLTSVTNALLGYALEHSEIITEEKVVEVHTFRIGAEEFNDDNDNQ